MPRHTDPLISFDVPRGWENRSIIAFAAPAQEGKDGAANIVITRDRLADDEELIDYAERHIDELEASMEGFFLLSSVQQEIGGKVAYTMTFESAGPEGTLAQRLTMVELAERVAVSVTLTTPERDLDQVAPLFDHMIDSIAWGAPS